MKMSRQNSQICQIIKHPRREAPQPGEGEQYIRRSSALGRALDRIICKFLP